MNVQEAITELRKEENKRKFEQGVDLIVNLKGVDTKRDSVNVVVTIPNKFKEKRVCGFFTKKNSLVDTIVDLDFKKYSDKKLLKNLIKKYDYFIAAAPLMPKIATTFGKVLGPAGKMPSPQLGIVPPTEDDASINATLEKISQSIKIRMKEASIKISVGKENMSDDEISANVKAVYKAIADALPKKKENVKNVMLKLTMSKPIRTEMN